jgi:hypothetical protein
MLRSDPLGDHFLPIHCAARFGTRVEVVALLLERGGRRQRWAKTRDADTPLTLAERYGRPEEIKALFRP